MATVDNLDIKIKSGSDKAVKSIDELVVGLTRVKNSLQSINSNQLKNFTTGVSNVGKVGKSMKNFTASTDQATQSVNSLAMSFGKLYANFFLAIRGVKALGRSIKTYMDFTETVNYFEVAISNIGTKASVSWEEAGYMSAEAYAKSFTDRLKTVTEQMSGFMVDKNGNVNISSVFSGLGMNPTTTMQYTAMFAQVADSIGVTEDAAASLSETFVKLGADWASLRNLEFVDAYEKLASGLSGQSRAMRYFGVDITQANLQDIATGLGITKMVSEMTQAEKSYLRLIAILRQSQVAFGDLANTISSPANQLRLLDQGVQNTSMLFGSLFMPLANDALPKINGLVLAFQKLIIIVGGALDIEMQQINTGTGGMTDGFADLTDSVDETTDSVNKFKKSVRGIDELNVLSSNSGSGDSVSAGLFDTTLISSYNDEIERYNRAWDEAYANMENKAIAISEGILKKIDVEKAASNLKHLTENVKALKVVVSPFVSGVGKGFAEYLKTLSEISLVTINLGLEALSGIIGVMPVDIIDSAGKALGIFLGSILAVKTATKLGDVLIKIATGVSKLGGVLTGNPILATFALAAGVAALFKLLEVKYDFDTTMIDNLADSLNNLKKSNKDALEEFNSGGDATKLQVIYDKWNAIASKTEELTDPDRGLLKLYGQMLKEMCPDITELIDENGVAFGDVATAIQKAIDKTKEYYNQRSASKVISELTENEIKLNLELEKSKKTVKDLKDEVESSTGKQYFTYEHFNGATMKTESTTASMEEIAKALYSRKKGSDQRSLAQNFGISESLIPDLLELGGILKKQDDYFAEIASIEENISIISEIYDLAPYTKMTESIDEASTAAKNMNKSISDSVNPLKDLNEAMSAFSTMKVPEIKIPVVFDIKQNVQDLLDSTGISVSSLLNIGSFKKYAVGGFPEDGWFRANHGEMLGKFDNGQSVVANNQQITDGIANAVYKAFIQAISESKGSENISVSFNGKNLFTIVREEAKNYQNRTGKPAF